MLFVGLAAVTEVGLSGAGRDHATWLMAMIIVAVAFSAVDAFRRRDSTAAERIGSGGLALFAAAIATAAIGRCGDTFELATIDRPDHLVALLVVGFLAAVAWITSARSVRLADRGVCLLVFLSALNRDLFLPEPHLIAMLGAAVLLLALADAEFRSLPRAIGLPLLLFVALVGLSVVLALDASRAQPAAAYVFASFAVCLVIAAGPSDPARLRLPLYALLAGAALVVTLAIVNTARVADVVSVKAAVGTRLGLLYQHPNMLGPYLGAMAVLAAGVALSVRSVVGRALLLALAFGAAGGLILTDSRAALVGLLAGAAVLALTRPMPATRRIGLAAGGVLLVVALAVAVHGSALADATRLARALDFRLDVWSHATAIIGDHPLLGVGPDTFPALELAESDSRFARAVGVRHPHNNILYVAQSSGVPAALAFVALLAGYLMVASRVLRGPASPTRSIVAACVASSAVFIVAGLADDSQTFTTLLSRPEWVFLGVVAAASTGRGTAPPVVRRGLVVVAIALLAFGVLGWASQALAHASAHPRWSKKHGLTLALASWRVQPSPLGLDRAVAALGQLSKIIAVLNESVENAPLDPERWHRLGSAYAATKDYDAAVAALDQAVELSIASPKRNGIRAARIRMLLRAKRDSEARDAAREAIRMDGQVLARLQGIEADFLDDLDFDAASIVEELADELLSAGQRESRYAYWNLFHAARLAHTGELPERLLDAIEQQFGGSNAELAAVAYHRDRVPVRAPVERDPDLLIAYLASRREQYRQDAARAVSLGDPTNQTAVAQYRVALANYTPTNSWRESDDSLALVQDTLQDYRGQASVFVNVLGARLRIIRGESEAADRRAAVERTLRFFGGGSPVF